MSIRWHPDTVQQVQSINQAITEIEDQFSIFGKQMLAFGEINEGLTASSITNEFNDVVVPQVNRILENFREFVKGIETRYNAAVEQDQENAR